MAAAAAAITATVQQPVTAHVVGNAFVQQYYHIQLQSPELVHRFYQDISKLGRPEENGNMSITTTIEAINEKILALNYSEYRAEIKSVDAQESYNGGVHVLVTGYLVGKDNMIRNFTQTFFLAPQEKGYFVLNDIFRYVEDIKCQNGNQSSSNGVEAPLSPQQDPSPVLDNHVSKQTKVSVESTDRASDTTSHSSESELQDVWSNRDRYRNYPEVLTGPEVHSPTARRMSESELPRQVLESLFNMPKSSEREPNTMNWEDVAKKMASLRRRFESDLTDVVDSDHTHAKGDSYHVLRKAASLRWDSMKSCYQKAAAAFSNGGRSYAAYLSEQGRSHKRLAQEADEKVSQEIFRSRNKNIENVITIDLHGQHVKSAVRLLKLHLHFGAYVGSVQVFRVITGHGKHGMGKSKVKKSVIDLIEREGIDWSEENQGTILIKLHGQREFAFLESQSDGE